MHIPCFRLPVHDVQLIILRVPGHGNQGGIQGPLLAPGALGHVPAEEHGVALLILERTLQGNLHRLHGHGAGRGDVRVPYRGGRNDRRSRRHTGHHTVFIHRGNLRIGRAPGDASVRYRPGQYRSGQGYAAASEKGHRLGGDLNAADLFRGGSPVAASCLFRDDQTGHLVIQVVI